MDESSWHANNSCRQATNKLFHSECFYRIILEPKIPPNIIQEFEQLIEISEIDAENILMDYKEDDIVKVSITAMRDV